MSQNKQLQTNYNIEEYELSSGSKDINPVNINISSFDLSKSMTFSKIFSKVKLSPTARLVLRALVDFWNPAKGLVYPGQKTISECTGASLRSVNSAIEELRKLGLILTTGESGERLKYYFTAKFFELTGIAQTKAKLAHPTCAKIAHHEQKNPKQINNNYYYQKTNFKNRNEWKGNQQMSINYNNPEKTRKIMADANNIKIGSPLDLSKDEQIAYYKACKPFVRKNTGICKEIKKRWGL